MSRSRRKHELKTWANPGTQKWWKQKYNRKLRRKTKYLIHKEEYEIFPVVKEVSDVWESPNDGHGIYFGLDKYEHMGRWWPGWLQNTWQTLEEEYKERLESYYKYLRK